MTAPDQLKEAEIARAKAVRDNVTLAETVRTLVEWGLEADRHD